MGCIHSQLSKPSKSRKRRVRKSAISKPRLITSPISTYSFSSDEKRPVPPSPPSTIKPRSDSQSSAESELSKFTTATSLTSQSQISTPTFIITESTPPRSLYHSQDEAEERREYLTQAEITSITTRVTKFVSSLTNYGQLIEKTHLALHADLSTILNLIPLLLPPPIPSTPPNTKAQENEVLKISLLSSHRSMKRLTRSKSKLSSMLSITSSPSSTISSPKNMPDSPHTPLVPSTPCSAEKFVQTPPYVPLSPTVLARNSLNTLQNSLSSTYNSQKNNFTQKYWPLITLLPRNWITFSRMGRVEQELDVRRHLRRRKGEFRAKDGLLLGLIRGLSVLAKDSCSAETVCGGGCDGEQGTGAGERAFEMFEEEVDREWEGILRLLKIVETEKRGEMEEGREWSPGMKWRVFGLVLKERVRILKEKKEEILRERVGLSAVLVGVFEDVGEGCAEV